MNLRNDCEEQFKKVIDISRNDELITEYYSDLNRLFSGIYILNYLSKRIELKDTFETYYFKISLSCLLEAYSLIINNYPRGAALVLRSSLENYLKHIISLSNNPQFLVHDRSYSANKKTFEKMINENYSPSLSSICTSINSKMEDVYNNLSGLSHSLTAQSQSNILEYFSDIHIVKNDNVYWVFIKFNEIITAFFSLSLIACQFSLKSWDSGELVEIMRFVFGRRKTNTYLNLLKENVYSC
ncbi:hypothetical protein [Salibacterium aidingense]|uniref:hypothetical protein n=1 Tax=Salibacterium aidingense TaxID=384933 RepID=UPI003BBC9182